MGISEGVDMKKQRDKSKASDLQEHLATKEVFQLVDPRKFGTASSRNERQLEKKMKSLHTQQNKRLAKLKGEIDEVRAHHRKLKEVDESARDPRTEIEKNTQAESGGHRGKVGRRKNSEISLGGMRVVKYLTQGGERSMINRSVTSAVGKESRPRSVTTVVYKRKYNEPNGFSSRNIRQEFGNGFASGVVAGRPNQSLPLGLLDIRVKRDTNLFKHYNYNLSSTDKVVGERLWYNTAYKNNVKGSELERDTRVNHLLIRNLGGKKNIHMKLPVATTKSQAEDTSNHGHMIHVSTSQAGSNAVTIDNEAANLNSRRIHFHEHRIAKSGTAHESFPSGEDEHKDSLSEPSEQNWAETLRKCRYLRKPKGYETPEIQIQTVFHE